jgi:hypothetical protein
VKFTLRKMIQIPRGITLFHPPAGECATRPVLCQEEPAQPIFYHVLIFFLGSARPLFFFTQNHSPPPHSLSSYTDAPHLAGHRVSPISSPCSRHYQAPPLCSKNGDCQPSSVRLADIVDPPCSPSASSSFCDSAC